MSGVWVRAFPPEEKEVFKPYDELISPRNMPDTNAQPVAYFYLFFTLNLMKQFVKETNRCHELIIHMCMIAKTFIATIGANSRVHIWLKHGQLNIKEFKEFIAVILNMGLIRKPTLEQYWKTPWFREMFSRNRFQLILKFLHVVNNKTIPSKGQQGYRPDAKFKPVIDHFNMRSKYLYKPSQKLSIDES
ncbi:hypothetical protein KUTeg_017670 [Tegillarca granosa]|uniref:PiggyBac transposable element-derived protein domain-containing protein n=1 Tax=Tegillarca granosa TaxID=220873 RepID=A0ABQ9EFL0_TEGGR|nr:hypothetical protein KUTeg_017670 [Tegillarca granosa]